jgi:hypothetical protein
MIATAALVLLLGAAPILPPPAPTAVAAVPDEPDALVLPDRPTYQAVAADVDGDGVRDVVRLVQGERGAIDLEVWHAVGDTWAQLGSSFNAIPVRATGSQGNIVYAGTPARLIVRSIGGVERATLVRQPRFEEPGLEVDCCLLLDDVTMVDGSPGLDPIAERGLRADAILAIDMDGDGTDELLVTQGLPPLGDTTFPTAVRLYRWDGAALPPPTFTELSVGSGFAPFVLGDSDGVPGDEAAFIGAESRLHRVSLRTGDVVVAESAEASVADAMAVPIDDGRGIAVMSGITGLAVRPWPRDQSMGESVATLTVDEGDLIGVVTMTERSRLLVREPAVEALHVLTLPSLDALGGPTVTRSPAAGTLASSPIAPYVGPLPGGGLDGNPAVIYAGRLLPSEDRSDAPFATLDAALVSTLAGAQPVGLVGSDGGSLAIMQAALPMPPLDPAGGRLDPPVVQPGSGVTIAPIEVVRNPERDDGVLEPLVERAIVDGRELIVDRAGFVAVIAAPPGSRVFLAEADPAVVGEVLLVPESGEVRLPVIPPPSTTPNPRYRAIVAVSTPAGRGYLAAWDVRVLNQPPAIEASVATPFGSPSVVVSGTTAPATEVLVAGRRADPDADGRFSARVSLPPWPTDVEIVATDLVGNESRTTVSGVGWFDYRGLPWIPIVLGLVAIAGAVLYLRVPRAREAARRADDDAVLEELEPD